MIVELLYGEDFQSLSITLHIPWSVEHGKNHPITVFVDNLGLQLFDKKGNLMQAVSPC